MQVLEKLEINRETVCCLKRQNKTQNHKEFHCILFIKHTFVYCVISFLLLLSGITVLALTSDCNYLSIMFS